jgi:GNAT superfamily N-acetyltransferase
VLEVDGELRGFASSGRAHDDDPPRDRALYTLYVLASEYGSGAGQALLEAVLGDAPAYLWVAAENPRATAFYERNGFVLDGVSKAGPRSERLVELRMVR